MAYGVEIEAADIRGVKTDFLRELIKNTSWSERGRISGLTDLEHKLVCGVQPRWASHVSYGNLLASYPTEYKAMVEELVQCDWLSTKRKDAIQAEYRTRMEREKKQAGESARREREVRERDREALLAWREAGGLE